MTVELIVLDQHSSTAEQVDEWDFETWKKVIQGADENEIPKLSGGDAEVPKALHSGVYEVRKVDENDEPDWGRVWFKKGSNGGLERYKTNYATK